MQTEYEARVLDIDKEAVTQKLTKLGAEFNGRFEQKRYTYHVNPPTKGKWIRLRDNGEQATLCYKSIISDEIDGTSEIEFPVPNFEETNAFMEHIGMPSKQYQENIRTQYHLDGVEVDIDEWPLIPPYLEVEGKSEQEVYDTIAKLGLQDGKVTSVNTQGIYEMYGIDLEAIKDLRFPTDEQGSDKGNEM